ncbi:carbon-nitrogen hydrolase [Salinibacterium sp. UTAS2018]|uniref:nitrilase family protein n=1 Tax=Salinibacterium sp. UTAS2018 TaxID=2508880 RepID=UPI0010094F5E|nr:nitrilase family protein [Salinibacterium sp. UTAS2018]QAV70585.1 carbon-nitrogen hydrolase [Salinibacterium sp. UTAS2018]
MTDNTVIVASCQVSLAVGDVEANRQSLRSALLRALDAGAQIIVLPELANTGYMFADLAELRSVAEPVDGPTVSEWVALAAEHGLIIIGGFAEAADSGAVYNSAVLIDSTGVRACYRKAHLWNTEKADLFTPGSGAPPVVDTALGRIGVMVCYDLEFPEWVRAAALEGAELLCCPVNWPLYPAPEGERPIEVVKVQAAAATNRMFVVAADRAGRERGQDWLGGSVIVDADGFPLTTLGLGAAGVHIAQLDLSDARNKTISERNNVHTDRRPELYFEAERQTNGSA